MHVQASRGLGLLPREGGWGTGGGARPGSRVGAAEGQTRSPSAILILLGLGSKFSTL